MVPGGARLALCVSNVQRQWCGPHFYLEEDIQLYVHVAHYCKRQPAERELYFPDQNSRAQCPGDALAVGYGRFKIKDSGSPITVPLCSKVVSGVTIVEERYSLLTGTPPNGVGIAGHALV